MGAGSQARLEICVVINRTLGRGNGRARGQIYLSNARPIRIAREREAYDLGVFSRYVKPGRTRSPLEEEAISLFLST